jgi:hypothetical protein
MTDWSRRSVLKLGLSSMALSLAGCGERPQKLQKRVSRERPRYYVIMLLGGGFDAIYTTNPKVAADLEPGIDLPYTQDEIVDAGDLQLGPHFAPLARWSKHMAIVNGVKVGVANHETASTQFNRMRTKAKDSMPSLLDVIAGYRDEQPLGCVTMGPMVYWDYSSGFLGAPEKIVTARAAIDPNNRNLFDEIDATDVADLERLAKIYRQDARRLRVSNASPERLTTAQNLDDCAALIQRLPTIPRFELRQWSQIPARQNLARNLQRILWLFENDLASCVYVRLGFAEWDSHYSNVFRQTEWNAHFATQLDQFLTELAHRRNAHGTLMSNTLVTIGSEIGRFPRINSDQGKDHFPEVSMMFLGSGIRGGNAFGHTGREMEAQPISRKTGRQVDAGGVSVVLDDVGTTLAHIAGVDAARHGYFGRRLEFLEAA